MDFIHDLFPLKDAPSANSEYAWLHRLLKRKQRLKKDYHYDGHGDVQGNEIAALDPSQESAAVSLDLSKAAVHSSSSDESDPMDFDSEVTEALAHLDHNPAPRANVKFPSHVSSSTSPSPDSSADGGQVGFDDTDHDEEIEYDGDSDEVENVGKHPAYATRSAHGVKPALTSERSDLSHFSPKPNKTSKSISSITEEGLRANKTLLLGKRIKIYFPNYGGSLGEVIEYDVVTSLNLP